MPFALDGLESTATIFCDFAADPQMGPDSAALNPRLYYDGTHPTAAGQIRLEPIIRPILNAVT